MEYETKASTTEAFFVAKYAEVERIGRRLGRCFGRFMMGELLDEDIEKIMTQVEEVQEEADGEFNEFYDLTEELISEISNSPGNIGVYGQYGVPCMARYKTLDGTLRGIRDVIDGWVEEKTDTGRLMKIAEKLKKAKEEAKKREEKVLDTGYHEKMYG